MGSVDALATRVVDAGIDSSVIHRVREQWYDSLHALGSQIRHAYLVAESRPRSRILLHP